MSLDRVFPTPRKAALDGGNGSAVEISAEQDEALPGQGYELVIGPEGTRVRYADELGLRYARQTLRQLAEAGSVQAGCITDWPDFPRRGFMLDVSRDRVPTMDTLQWLVHKLAELRYNHLELYMEHTFAYAGHETVWRNASPITPPELRHLDELCRANGIELVANQNTFGHMDRWLQHDDYRDRAECPDGSEHPAGGRRLPPWGLEPTPDNAAFALSLVRELAGNLRSRRVNIGGDEPFDLGLGSSRAAVAERGRAAVFVEHLRRLTDPLIAEGHQVHFWGDGLTRHGKSVSELPEAGATAVVWLYEAPDPNGRPWTEVLGPELAELLGVPEDANLGFKAYARPYVDAGYPFWVAPGTSSWNSFVGRWTNARANLLDAAITGRGAGCHGYLVTDWGDNGHPQPLTVSIPAAAYGAGVAWCRASNQDVDVAPVVDRLLAAAPGVGARLLELGDLYRRLGVSTLNGSPLMAVMVDPQPKPLRGRLDSRTADTVEAQIGEAHDWFAGTPFRGARRGAMAAELVAMCRLLRQGLWRLHKVRGERDVDDAFAKRDLAEVISLYREAWLATSRPGGLEDSVAKLTRFAPAATSQRGGQRVT